ncbi:MAG TPA: hypothetical protein VKA14_00750, partial [Gammaproteobacteria bacterium]|nr:hypothetical protein [Gammaproteobacteria bacterium]
PSGDAAADKARGDVTTDVYSLDAIETGDGVVLGQGSGVKAILLRGRIDSRAGQGTLVIKYLTNGLLMTYNECRLGLKKTDSGSWNLINAYTGAPIKRIRIKTWTLGISTLENVCPGSDTYASR